MLIAVILQIPKPQANRINPNDVRGSAIIYNRQHFTLNFNQQNALIASLNDSFDFKHDNRSTLDYGPIVIYRFVKPDIFITPLSYIEENLLFSTPIWNNGNPMLENSNGKLKDILEGAYDHAS
jgi:hypothetical protein